MPAYLTQAAVVIKMTEWLELLRAKIDARKKAFAKSGKPLTSLDERFYYLAGQALFYLREDPSVAADVALPVTNIKNGIGTRISKYAFVGSLGPDIPAAGYILAMNQDWAWHTLHNGEPRRARKNALTTTFVLKLLEAAEKDEKDGRLTSAQRRRVISYALGHLSHIAADVVLHPAIHQLTWTKPRGPLDPLEHQLFEVAIDARLAQGFFNRDDLYDNIQSWEDYYLDNGDFEKDLQLLFGEMNTAFKATFGDERPNAPVCGLSDPTKCAAPKFDAAFLMDGYSNTTNWAIDGGYDHGPLGYDIFWSLCVIVSIMGSAISLAKATEKYSTILSIPTDQIDRLTVKQGGDWQQKGIKDIDLWRRVVDTSLKYAGYVALPLEYLAQGGIPLAIITFGQAGKGFFGQNKDVDDSNPAIRPINDVVWAVKTIVFILLSELTPELVENPNWAWPWFLVDYAHDPTEHFFLQSESKKDNYSEDRIRNATYGPKKILGLMNFLGNAMMLLFKTDAPDDAGGRSKGLKGEDLIAPAIFTAASLVAFIWSGVWRDHLLFKTTKSRWPSSDVKPVETLLPVHTPKDRKELDVTKADKFKVRLFTDDKLTKTGTEEYYPDGGGAPGDVDGQAARDLAARTPLLEELLNLEYTLPDLLDRAAQFAGLLGMAAVAYNETAAPVRPHMTAIFKDWNLDFSTVKQWKELLDQAAGGPDMGMLEAARLYTADLEAQTDTPNGIAISRLGSALGVTDVAGGVIADFAHKGDPIDSVDPESSRALRITRPGAALLPNVDIDTPVPSPLPSPLPVRTTNLDALADDTVNPIGNDRDELTEFRVRKPEAAGSPHTLVLRLHAADASRVRVFQKDVANPPQAWAVVLGFTSAGVKTEFEIPAAAPDQTDYVIEVKGFAGDPGMPAPPAPAPLSPAPFGTGGATVGNPVVADRRESEVWIEVIHKDAGTEVPGIRDVALFGISPLILVNNFQPADRIYAVYGRDQFDTAGNLRRPGNFPFISDIIGALRSDPLIAPRITVDTTPATKGTLDEFVPHKPVSAGDPDEAKALYVVDGSTYAAIRTIPDPTFPSLFLMDRWVQDEFEICYAQSARTFMHVILHTPRKIELSAFVEKELPSVDVGLFNGVSALADSINFGGNLEVSPAVTVASPPQPRGAAGPEVPAQPPSPLGKIILGEGTPFLFDIAETFSAQLQSRTIGADLVTAMTGHGITITTADTVEVLVNDREWMLTDATFGQTWLIRRDTGVLKVHVARLSTKEYKHFLEVQRVQPIVTVDTSWLKVGHVDEILIFVPAPASSGKKFRLLMASSQLAVQIFQEAQFINAANPVANPLTKTFRGQSWVNPRPSHATALAAEDVSMTLTTHGTFNNQLQTRRLTPIEDRLKATLGLDAADIIRVPVFYDVLPLALLDQMGAVMTDSVGAVQILRTSAYSPGVVNLQMFDNHALIPRPHVARMKREQVIEVLKKVGVDATAADKFTPGIGSEQWATAGTTTASLASTFGTTADAIKVHVLNAGKFNAANKVIKNWDRIFIPENTVDLFEAYMQVKLKEIGVEPHFIEDWATYHRLDGEVHCGTNVRRTPAEVASGYSGPKWWDCPSVKT